MDEEEEGSDNTGEFRVGVCEGEMEMDDNGMRMESKKMENLIEKESIKIIKRWN